MTRENGKFDIRTMDGTLVQAKYTACTILQRQCGYKFSVERIGSAQHSNP